MALSDWDAAAWDSTGQPCMAHADFGNGVVVEMRRAFLVVEDAANWTEESGHHHPVAAILDAETSGMTAVSGLRVAVGTARNATFFLVASNEGTGTRLFGSIGRYGWVRTLDVVGETCRRYGISRRGEWFRSSSYSSLGKSESIRGPGGMDLTWWTGDRESSSPITDDYVGIGPSDMRDFTTWIEGIASDPRQPLGPCGDAIQDWLSLVQAAGCLRYCQGDGYIADAVDGLDLTATAAGEAGLPWALSGLDDRPITRLPHRSFADWLDARVALFAGKQSRRLPLRPGLTRTAAPAAWRRLEQAAMRADNRVEAPSERSRLRRERAKLRKVLRK